MAAGHGKWRSGMLLALLAAVLTAESMAQAGEAVRAVSQRRYAFSYFPRYPYSYFSRYPYSYFPRYPYSYFTRYPFSYFPRYPFSYFHRYPFGYYQGGYRYPFSYPYYSYGAYSYGLQGSYGAGFGPGFGPAFGGLPLVYGPQPWDGLGLVEPKLPMTDWLAEIPLVPIEPEFGMEPQFAPEEAPPAPEGAVVDQPARTVPGPLLVRPYTGLWLGDRPADRRRLYGP